MIALTPKVISWCCSADKKLPESDRTQWDLGDMTEGGMVEMNNAMRYQTHSDGSISQTNGSTIYIYVKNCLRGITEGSVFPDADGNAIEFERDRDGRPTDAFLARITWDVQSEMCVAIMSGLKMDVEEKEE